MFLIIDGSSMLSTAYYGSLPREVKFAKTQEEKEKYYNKIMQTSDGVYTNGIYTMLKMILRIIENQKPDRIAVVFDKTRNTFRKELYSEYKAQRGSTPSPLKEQFVLMEEILAKIGIPVLFSDEYEADDYAGSLTEKFCKNEEVYLMSKDQDYLQLVDDNKKVKLWMGPWDQKKVDSLQSKHNIVTKNIPNRTIEFNEELINAEYGLSSAKLIIDWKALSGDKSDNIPGVNGISDKTAIPLLNEYGSVEGIYEAIDKYGPEIEEFWKENLCIKKGAYKKFVAGKDNAFLSKQLATIKTDICIDKELEDFKCEINQVALTEIINKYQFNSLKN